VLQIGYAIGFGRLTYRCHEGESHTHAARSLHDDDRRTVGALAGEGPRERVLCCRWEGERKGRGKEWRQVREYAIDTRIVSQQNKRKEVCSG
jgi:hypothetical protein